MTSSEANGLLYRADCHYRLGWRRDADGDEDYPHCTESRRGEGLGLFLVGSLPVRL